VTSRRLVARLVVLALALPPALAFAKIPVGVPIARLSTTEKVIALSFDDGPRDSVVFDSLMAILAHRNVHATFFVIGSELVLHPELAGRLLAAGHELGNHTWTHPHLDSIPVDSVRVELARTDSLLRALGVRGRILFRPPYGETDEAVLKELKHEHRVVALFDVDPSYDFPTLSSPDSVVAKTVNWLGPGSILVMHPWYERSDTTLAMVPLIVDWLQRLGYRVTTVSDLLKTRHAKPELSLYHRPE